MGSSRRHPLGVVHYEPSRCYRGYTLFCNNAGAYHARLIDMEGRVCHEWDSPEGIGYGFLLDNGNLLMRTHPSQDGSPLPGLPGGAAALLELDWESNPVWEYRGPMMHLDFERLSNGNTLVLQWAMLPEGISAQVRGGFQNGDLDQPMVGDLVSEITPSGDTVWQWKSWEHLSFEEDVICPLEHRREWTHQNALNLTSDEDLLVSFRQISTIGIVDRTTGNFRWKWGPGQVSHQHHPTALEDGRILLFDNGSHHPRPIPHSRVIEVDPDTNEIGWEYQGAPPFSFFSPVISSAQSLPNGNTLICEGSPGRIFEVTPKQEIVWEYINPFFTKGARPMGGGPEDLANSVFRAHRYGPDHPALSGKDLDPARYSNLNRLYTPG